MAVVLVALASCVQNMLTKMVNDEVAKMLGVTDEINKLITKLKFLKSFLSDADKRNITEEVVEVWVKELRDAMYEATDIMDLLQLMGMKLGPQLKTGRMNSLVFSIGNPLRARDISSRIKNLNKKLDLITACSGSYNFQKLSTDDMKRHVASSSLAGLQTSGNIVVSDVVGEKIEEDTINLVEILIKEEEVNKHEDNKIKILAIVGVGGIGKTTLAKNVFNNNIIQAEFTKKIWLSVNRDFRQQDLLSQVISQASEHHKEAYGVHSLEGSLKASLKGHKTLLVMDDVWDHRAWEDVLMTPLENSIGCGTGIRVLVTTRLDTVALQMKANKPYFRVDKLQPEDSWSLLRMQVVGNENGESGIDELKDIGMRIIEKCDYLPLAVKAIGGILGKKSISESVWQNLLDDFTRSVPKLPEKLNNAVYLSYQDLPPPLKQCFLHYSLLPKGMDVHVDSIVAMWISEGFVGDSSFKLEELGREYYNELISRNLIEPNTKHLNQSICSMHDVVRLFGQHVARGEALVAHMGQMCPCEHNSQKLRQLCLVTIGFESNDELAWSILRAQRSLRTLILVGPIKMNPGDSWGIFSSLRILDLSLWNNANCDELVESLYRLKHLRYLSMERCGISKLPKKLSKMKLLQYINICQNESLVELPPGIVDLCQLRSLDLRGTGIVNGVPKLFHELKYLRMLEGFPAYMDDDDKWCSLQELKDLNRLMVLVIDGLVNVTKSSFAKMAGLGEKGCLIRLHLSCKRKLEGNNGFLEEHDIDAKRKQIVEVFDELSPPPCLEELVITDYFGWSLPRWMMMSTPELPALRNLRTLLIHNLYHCTELPGGLCQLPFLEFLQIHVAPCIKWVGPEFLNLTSLHRRNNFHVEKSAFPRLRKLNLVGMENWENWEWDQQMKAMPNIEVLAIFSCKLRRLPPGLAFYARALRELHVHNVEHLSSLEDFVSVNRLEVYRNPLLERIGNLPKLQELIITKCPKMKMLDGVPKLQRLSLKDDSMEALPSYLKHVHPRHLLLDCSFWLLASVATGESSPEWGKLYHIQHVNAYAKGGGDSRKWYVLYTRNPSKFETNIRLCAHHYHAQEEHHVNIHSDEGNNQVVPMDGTPVGLQLLRRYTRFSLAGIGIMKGALFILLLAASLHWVLLLQKIHGQREQ